MQVVLIVAGVVGYLAIAAATMRLVAWDSARRGMRGMPGEEPCDELFWGLAWPLTLPVAVFLCLHRLATRGIPAPASHLRAGLRVSTLEVPPGVVPPSTSTAPPRPGLTDPGDGPPIFTGPPQNVPPPVAQAKEGA